MKIGLLYIDKYLYQANIVVSKAGVPMLTDFGQSRAWNYTLTMMKTTTYERGKGTANWAAYELVQFVQDPKNTIVVCTGESDMWAYGMVLFVGFYSLPSRENDSRLFPGDPVRTDTLCSV